MLKQSLKTKAKYIVILLSFISTLILVLSQTKNDLQQKGMSASFKNQAEPIVTILEEQAPKRTMDSYIDGDFNGWSGETIYKLDNGQYWQQIEYDYGYDYDYHPKISIYETENGFKMSVHGYDGEDVSVHQVFNVIESRINGEYKGWEGETTYSLTNGQVWRQSSYYYHYHYAYSPKVLIYNSTMHVEGDDDKGVKVVRLK